MKVKQLPDLSALFEIFFRYTNLAQILAVGTLAMGASIGISSAPAHGVALNGGQVVFTGETTGFLELQDAVAGNSFNVTFNFNPDPAPGTADNAKVSSASAPFTTYFNQNPNGSGSYPLDPQTQTVAFKYVSGDNDGFTYTLDSNLVFAFENSVTLTIKNDTRFVGNNSGTGVSLSNNSPSGAFYSQGTIDTPVKALSFTLNDITSGSTGGYSILASTVEPVTASVPEPLTIVGTILGGAAAVRIKRKLTDAARE
ncbi:PEP-CTERM sorting domain-containing protein [Chamaesiphon sp. OTE_8_metabat_110]|uniref:PEP-CTERM sorting domain-containing protein n=1 Tax=Chamaesiphon sp. OTE_8_metabat_110 TaxID=2964696 RepID=UPI00286C19D0|nr:PEP-CTERM sorting domain-containing protein [Chamaesiphon sp. OTE_8_metabat_110]